MILIKVYSHGREKIYIDLDFKEFYHYIKNEWPSWEIGFTHADETEEYVWQDFNIRMKSAQAVLRGMTIKFCGKTFHY